MSEISVRDDANAIQKKAWNLYTELQAEIKEQAKLFLLIGRNLKIVRDEHLYRQIGEGGFDTFEQFINNPEIGLRYSTAYLYIRIYEYYVERLKLLQEQVIRVPVNRLMRLLPVLKKKDDDEARGIVEEISEVTNYDYDQLLIEKKLDLPDRPRVYRCKECGKWKVEIKPEQLCNCEKEQS